MKLQFKRIQGQEQVEQLTKSNTSDAGLDIASNQDVMVMPRQDTIVSTGIAVAIPEGYCGRVAPRSGLKYRQGIKAFEGTIDSAYRGELKVILENPTGKAYQVKKGDRIAQLLTVPCELGLYEEVVDLDTTERGEGGFGSTGV